MKRYLAVVIVIVFAVTILVYCDRRTMVNIEPPAPDPDWNAGSLVHLLPTVNHNRILIKTSFENALAEAPRLKVDERYFTGLRMDSRGYFWCFDARNLEPSTTYQMVIQDSSGNDLCDYWPLSTFPAPDDRPERLRLLIYTGFGGHDVHITWRRTGPLPLSTRRRLLQRALSLKPDALISSGDQIYYDLVYGRSPKYMGMSPESIAYAGEFDRSIPVLGTANEEVLKKAVGPQIAYLYGTACRSVPTFFLLDDHDYFENDEARPQNEYNLVDLFMGWRSPLVKGGASFPPDNFMLQLGRASQRLYLPEFLPDDARPLDLPGSNAPDRAEGVSECYGTLRYGTLVEALLYESRRYITLTGKDAVFIAPEAENWLIDRMAAEEATHVVHVPAIVFGWSAGKWLEWYPDVRDEERNLTTDRPKYLWQEGWFAQHNRLLRAASRMKRSIPLFICGDLHSLAEGRILRSGDLDLSSNPVIAVASGSLGTGPRGFPSGALRRMVAQPPTGLTVEERLPCVEKNGFVIVDFAPHKITIRFFAWKPPEPLNAIDTLEPFHILELKLPNESQFI
ncbi:MAG: hypothetical protein JSV16_01725 [Candidatus Hydrogenedentota bacterium]|nr:MAG: hypothetical protein JSV16_01725 [Candidatus Hydrogenedentota bacterium]